jgi:catecholate siderophore receptor
MGALAAYAVGGTPPMPVWAQQPKPPVENNRSAEQSQLPVYRFDIPAGPLDAVLVAFQKATQWKVALALEAIATLQSPGVSGLHTAEQALQLLLTGTGVTYRLTGPQAVSLELKPVEQTVVVTEQMERLASPKYTEPLRDTPQTIMVIPRGVIEEQGATSLRDVLRNVPGLTIAAGEGGAPAGDNLTLRGFSARNDLFVDGARDISPQSRDPFNTEQVEVTKGPTSAISGRGSTGGVINMVSKAPGIDRFFHASAMFGSDETKRLTGDVNVPVKFLGDRTHFRLNLLAHEGDVAGRDVTENQRWGVAPALALGLGTPSRLTLSYYKLKQDNLPDYGIPWVTATQNVLAEYRDQPAPVPRETFYGLRSRDVENINSDLATVRFEYDFSDTLRLRNQLRYGRATRNSITTAPRFASNDSLVINRNGPSWITEDDVWDNQADLNAQFKTGGIQHSAVGGFSLTHESNLRWTRAVTGSPTTTLYNPNPNDPFNGAITLSPIVGDVTGNTQAVYLFDTAKLHEKLEAVGGLRWERFDVDGMNTAAQPVVRVDKMLSGRAGLVFKPVERGSIYASYGTSLNPSLEGLSYGVANTAIEPEKTYTTEIGTKWDVDRNRLMLSAAIFRVDKTNARTPGVLPDDPPQVLQGRQRVRGVELAATGAITQRLRVYSAYTLLYSEIVESNTPAEVGKEFQNTPRHSASIWSSYQVGKLTLGGGPRFISSRYGNNTNTRQVDSYWTFDALVAYPVTSKVDLRLNVYNLNNAYYFDRLGGGHLIPGPARYVMGGVNLHF